MKKLLLIIGLLSIFFLTGCGAFSLNGWVWPEDDLEFIAMIEELDTPQEISDYMMENFEYEIHALWTPNPYAFWKRGKGDCNDYATFGVFVANYHGYETYQIKIFYNDTSWKHFIAVYVEDGGFSFSDNQYYNYRLPESYRFNNFKDIVDYNCSLRESPYNHWSKYIVYDYKNNIVEKEYSYVH